jgi:hemerythrin-like domain-containing protein
MVARLLLKATKESARGARTCFVDFWKAEGARHLRVEEELLLPALARHASADHEAVVRVLADHVELRRRAADLEADPIPAPEVLRQLGDLLRRHIRYEERVLFPLIEQAVPEAALQELVAEMARADGSS